MDRQDNSNACKYFKNTKSVMGNIAIIDIETSGFSQKTNAICQIAGIVVTNRFEIVATIDNYIKPYGKVYTQKAFEINNLSEEFLNEFGEMFGAVINDFISFLYENNITTIVGHNFDFDKRFILEALPQNSRLYFDNITIVDTYKRNWPSFLKNRRLETICKYYNIPYIGKHNAMQDCESTLSLFRMLINNQMMFI